MDVINRGGGNVRNAAPKMTYGTTDFIKSARRAFAWLKAGGFGEAATQTKNNLYGSIAWVGEYAWVRVSWDIHDEALNVALGPLKKGRQPSPLEERDQEGRRLVIPLWLLTWVMTSDEAFARSLTDYSPGTPDAIEDALRRNATALQQFGPRILDGDFDLLPVIDEADQARMQANVEGRPWGTPPRFNPA